ncbi:MAG: hypothetical protein IJU48_09975 [Synergistaceae bacterium]|nr:hypothetical protein [Synergistaceae bacterium]
MSDYTAGAWRYRRENDGTFTIYPAWHEWRKDIVLARVLTPGKSTAEPNARLMASAPEMHTALIAAGEVMKAISFFLSERGLSTEELDAIIGVIDDLLGRIDGIAD